jgi:hypothetical protein
MLRVADRVDEYLAGSQVRRGVAGCLDAELWVDAGSHGCLTSRPTRRGTALPRCGLF